MTNEVLKFSQIAGLCGRKNDLLLFCRNKLSSIRRLAFFFHGDLQNYEEYMLSLSYTKDYVEFSLENTVRLIADKFLDHAILAIKCSEMSMNRFARYRNFINYRDELVDLSKTDFDALQHLEQLIRNLKREIELNADYQDIGFNVDNLSELICVGFSSGCTLINQLMIGLHQLTLSLEDATKRKQSNLSNNSLTDEQHLTGGNYLSCSIDSSVGFGSSLAATRSLSASFTDNKIFFEILSDELNKRLNDFYKKLTKLIFLDLGCNAVNQEVFVLDEAILRNIVKLGIEVQVHCTPYQINCPYRPYIKDQEREFGLKLKRLKANYKRRLYFKGSSSSIVDHFKLLKEFEPF